MTGENIGMASGVDWNSVPGERGPGGGWWSPQLRCWETSRQWASRLPHLGEFSAGAPMLGGGFRLRGGPSIILTFLRGRASLAGYHLRVGCPAIRSIIRRYWLGEKTGEPKRGGSGLCLGEPVCRFLYLFLCIQYASEMGTYCGVPLTGLPTLVWEVPGWLRDNIC